MPDIIKGTTQFEQPFGMVGSYHLCAICGKKTYTPAEYVYKRYVYYAKKRTATVYFCRYDHMREWDRMLKPKEEIKGEMKDIRTRLITIRSCLTFTKKDKTRERNLILEQKLKKRLVELEQKMKEIDERINEGILLSKQVQPSDLEGLWDEKS